MSGWFTTWTFWVGAGWGCAVGFLFCFYWLARPMARLLGFEPEQSSPGQAG